MPLTSENSTQTPFLWQDLSGEKHHRLTCPVRFMLCQSYVIGLGSYYDTAVIPGYVVEDQHVTVETNLYDRRTENLLWSSRSDTIILDSDQELIKSFIQVMVNKMADDGRIK